MKSNKYKNFKYFTIFLIFFIVNGCKSGQQYPPSAISPEIDKRLYKTAPVPLTMGIYIDPNLKNFVQIKELIHYNVGYHRYEFQIGKHLSEKIEEATQIIFKRIISLEGLNSKDISSKTLDGILVFRLDDSKIDLIIDESVLHAIGEHRLTINVSLYNTDLMKLWKEKIIAEGKGLDFVASHVEWEWWVTLGPHFGSAIDHAIENLTYKLSQKLPVVKEILEGSK